jgi:hypothetical protein
VRNALVTAQDEQLIARAQSDLAAGLLEITADEETGEVGITLTAEAAATDYYVAVYTPEGESKGSVPSAGGPIWPETFPLEKTITQGTATFSTPAPAHWICSSAASCTRRSSHCPWPPSTARSPPSSARSRSWDSSRSSRARSSRDSS